MPAVSTFVYIFRLVPSAPGPVANKRLRFHVLQPPTMLAKYLSAFRRPSTVLGPGNNMNRTNKAPLLETGMRLGSWCCQYRVPSVGRYCANLLTGESLQGTLLLPHRRKRFLNAVLAVDCTLTLTTKWAIRWQYRLRLTLSKACPRPATHGPVEERP